MNGEDELSTGWEGKAIRVIGTLASPIGNANYRRRKLMQQLVHEVRGEAWVWAFFEAIAPKSGAVVGEAIGDGIDGSRMTSWLDAIRSAFCESSISDLKEVRPDATPFTPSIPPTTGKTAMRFASLALRQQLFDTHGFGDVMHFLNPGQHEGVTSLVGVAKLGRASPLSESDAQLLSGVLSHVRWLHTASEPATGLAKRLTPTQRTVLSHLRRGLRRSQIAAEMGITRQTARDHIRAVLRVADARDQLDLVCRIHSGRLA